MKSLEKGQDKIQKISEQLRFEILEPAQEEAKKLIEEARKKASHIILEAEKQAEELIHAGRKAIEQERNVFHSSLEQSSKQVMEALRQSIEKRLFNDALYKNLRPVVTNPHVIADLISAFIKAIAKYGASADLSAVIAESVSVKEVNELLTDDILKCLKEQSVVLGDFPGGVRIKFIDKNLTVDISEETLVDLLARYVRKDFRKLIFASVGER